MNRRTFLDRSLLTLGSLGLGTGVVRADWGEATALPALAGFDLEGTLPSLKGKVVYLDFWASWCSPCKASFPVLDQWQRTFGEKGFTVLGVSVDEKTADMHSFLAKNPVSFPVVRDSRQKLVAAANVKTMPTSFLVDRQGIIRHVHRGFRRQDEDPLTKQIAALVAAR